MLDFVGAPGRIRTSGPQIRSLMLYPAELRAPSRGYVRAECAAVLSGMLRLAARRRAGKLFSQLFSLRQSIRFGKAAHLSGIEDREVATPEGNSISEFMQSAAFPNR